MEGPRGAKEACREAGIALLQLQAHYSCEHKLCTHDVFHRVIGDDKARYA